MYLWNIYKHTWLYMVDTNSPVSITGVHVWFNSLLLPAILQGNFAWIN